MVLKVLKIVHRFVNCNLLYTNTGILHTKHLFHFFVIVMATIMITGGTGMVGTALTKELVSRDHNVIILTRDRSGLEAARGTSYAEWDLHKQTIDKEAVERSDFIVHLAGANLGKGRW